MKKSASDIEDRKPAGKESNPLLLDECLRAKASVWSLKSKVFRSRSQNHYKFEMTDKRIWSDSWNPLQYTKLFWILHRCSNQKMNVESLLCCVSSWKARHNMYDRDWNDKWQKLLKQTSVSFWAARSYWESIRTRLQAKFCFWWNWQTICCLFQR